MFRRIQNEKGFTLIELLIVIVVLGILAAIVIPNYTGLRDKAYHVEAESAGRAIALALEMYKIEKDEYPAKDDFPDEIKKVLSNYNEIIKGNEIDVAYEPTDAGYTLTINYKNLDPSVVFKEGGILQD